MPEVAVLEVSDLELGKHARAQLKDYFEEIEVEEVSKVTEVPWTLEKLLERNKGAILLIDGTEQEYMHQAVGKVLDVEMDADKPVQKLILEKENESQELFKDRAQEAARENAEKLADKIKNSGEEEKYEEV
jgi:6,7-dimethyl-8-ribityllumazine synthase